MQNQAVALRQVIDHEQFHRGPIERVCVFTREVEVRFSQRGLENERSFQVGNVRKNLHDPLVAEAKEGPDRSALKSFATTGTFKASPVDSHVDVRFVRACEGAVGGIDDQIIFNIRGKR